MVAQGNKEKQSITMSPYLSRRAKELVDDKKAFSSVSDILSVSFAQFLLRYDDENVEQDVKDAIVVYLKGPEGRELIRKVIQDILSSGADIEEVTSHA